MAPKTTEHARRKAMVIHPQSDRKQDVFSSASAEEQLDEACALAQALHLDVGYAAIIPLRHKHAATFLSRGIKERLHAILRVQHLSVVCINANLSALQHRNLEQFWRVKVLERTAMILHLFAHRAKSFEGRLQVELAELNYQKSRLVRIWTHLERQRGGMRALAGPGEHQKESDKRQIHHKLTILKKRIKTIQRTRQVQRQARHNMPLVALVGYTNAGKSTLFKALTREHVFIKNQLFATLDTTMRAVKNPRGGQNLILSDTVGFIANLPPQLIAAFAATLEDIKHADIILHVRDCTAHPHQRFDVETILTSMGLAERLKDPMRYLEVLNKRDLLTPQQAESLQDECNGYRHRTIRQISLSALDDKDCQNLRDHLFAMVSQHHRAYQVTMKPYQSQAVAWLYAHAHDVTQNQQKDGRASLTLRLSDENERRFAHLFPDIRLNRDRALSPN